MPARQARVREVASQALPPLSLGPKHSKSNALHDIEFVGELHHWSNFLRFVEIYVQGQKWSNKVIKYTRGLGDLRLNHTSLAMRQAFRVFSIIQ